MERKDLPRWIKEDMDKYVCIDPKKKCKDCIYYKDESMYPMCKTSKWFEENK